MKTKKLVLNKKTVAHLNRDSMKGARGGAWSYYDSCALSDNCLTNFLCNSGLPDCECTGLCTMFCETRP